MAVFYFRKSSGKQPLLTVLCSWLRLFWTSPVTYVNQAVIRDIVFIRTGKPCFLTLQNCKIRKKKKVHLFGVSLFMTHEFKTRFEQNDCVCWLAGCRAGQDLCVTSLQPPQWLAGSPVDEQKWRSVKQTSVWFCWAAPSLFSDPSPVERKNKTPCFLVSKWMWRAEMRWGIVWSKSLLSSNGAFTFSSKLVGFRSLALWDSLGFWEASITTSNIILFFTIFFLWSPTIQISST